MIEIDGVELRTAAQWEKKHRHVKKGQLGKGVERTWRSPNGNATAMFYNIEQTRPWAKKDVEAVNRRRRADAKAKREAEERERIEGAARAEQHRKDLLDCWGLTSTRKPCRRAAATTRPSSGARWGSYPSPRRGGGSPGMEAIPHGITVAPGMCAMTPTAPRSCWRRGRASTTGCPTVVRTMATPGGKHKKRGGSKTLPVSLAVSTSLPASPVDLASVVNIDNKDDENIVLDIGDYPIVADPIAPET